MRWVVRATAAALLLFALAWATLHWAIVPRIDQWRPRLEKLASEAVSAPVSIGAIQAESNALVPSVALLDVQVRDPEGRVALRVPRVLAAFSVLSLARGGLEQLVIDRPELQVRRTAEGRLLAGGIDLAGGAPGDAGDADWFFAQHEVVVRGARVTWIDEQRPAPPLSLDDVQLVVRGGSRRHQIRLDATPPQGWGQRLTVIGQFSRPVFSLHAGRWREWDGQIYASLPQVDVSRLRERADLSTGDQFIDLLEGQGALRAWADVRQGALAGVTADLALGAVSVRFGPDLEPLALAGLSGRFGWRGQPGAGQLETHGLRFVAADGHAWSGGDLALAWRDGQSGQPAGGELRGNALDLAAISWIADRLPLPAPARAQLLAHPAQGLVERLAARWNGPPDAPRDWSVQAHVSALSIGAAPAPANADGTSGEGVPGIEGASLDLDATSAGGKATLAIRDGALEFPGVFEEPRIPLAELSLRARWRLAGERIEADVDELALRNPDVAGSFKASWHTGEGEQPRFPGVLDLQGSFSRIDGARVYRYLPLAVNAPARRYVREAVQKGQVRDVAVRVKGNLDDVPFDKHPAAGEFRFAGQAQGVTLAYMPRSIQPKGQLPWPPLEDLAGELIFERASMRVVGGSARVQGRADWQFPRIQAGIADFGHTRVLVDADGRGALATALAIVRQSPAAQLTRHALDRASASGQAALKLGLDLPVDRIRDARVDGQLTLQGNDLRLTPDTPPLAQAQGAVSFSETGFIVQNVQAQTLGGPAHISGGLPPQANAPVLLHVSGAASAEGLRQMDEWAPLPALARQASGSAAYEASIGWRAGAPDIKVSSDLRGMAFNLPAPLDKSADAAWPLRLELGPAADAGPPTRTRWRLTLADRLALQYELDEAAQPPRVLRGAFGIGPQAVAGLTPPASGVLGRLQLPSLPAGAWADVADRLFDGPALAAGHGFMPTVWSLRVDELLTGQRALHDVTASGVRDGLTWRADAQARELAGRIEYSEGAGGQAGLVRARLARLAIGAGAPGDDSAPPADPQAHIPALDIVADQFELRGKKLGRLEVQATSRVAGGAQQWQLSHLLLHAPEASFNASGAWAAGAPGQPRRTQLDFKLDIHDAGALLARLGMPGALARGKGALAGAVGWAGTPFSPDYSSMDGQLHLDVDAGQFLKADPGIAKLLGVLSLQALPRRLTLDFRDVFSAGFAFDFVRGDITVKRGVASANNLQMKGVNATVLMEGGADLDKETQDLHVVVIPEIDASSAALGVAVINPVAGLGAFLTQLALKKPLMKAATREFHIGGSWDDPQVTRLDKPANGASAPAQAASAPPPAEPAKDSAP